MGGDGWRGGPGFTDPYTGKQPCSRLHRHGFTFRWCRGDSWIGVQRGTVVDTARVLIVADRLEEHTVISGPVPVIDVIPIGGADWNDGNALSRIADQWTQQRVGRRGA